jgi:hypothetical protein
MGAAECSLCVDRRIDRHIDHCLQDLPGALSDAQVAEGLGLTTIKNRDWFIVKTSAIKVGDCPLCWGRYDEREGVVVALLGLMPWKETIHHSSSCCAERCLWWPFCTFRGVQCPAFCSNASPVLICIKGIERELLVCQALHSKGLSYLLVLSG